jgi:hypothetical protein
MPIKTLRDTVHIFSWGSCILNCLVYSHVYHLKCLLVQVWYWTEFSNMTGEEIISGAQRVHTPELLRKRAIECGIDASTISSYIESFRFVLHPYCVTASEYCSIYLTCIAITLVLKSHLCWQLQLWCPSSRWFRCRVGESGDAFLRPQQHQENFALPSRPIEAHTISSLWDRQLVANACTMLTNLLVKYRNNLMVAVHCVDINDITNK